MTKAPSASVPRKLGMANYPSHYEICVSQQVKGKQEHLFATDSRSLPSRHALINLHRQLTKAFPAPQYEITVCACYEFRRYIAVDPATGIPDEPAPVNARADVLAALRTCADNLEAVLRRGIAKRKDWNQNPALLAARALLVKEGA